MADAKLTLVIVTPKAIRAVLRAAVLAEELAENYEWDARAQELAKALRYAARHIGVERDKAGG